MKKNLILFAVTLMFANSALAQEDRASASETKNPQVQTEESKQLHHSKELKLKEQIEHKEYHDNDGWVQYLDSN